MLLENFFNTVNKAPEHRKYLSISFKKDLMKQLMLRVIKTAILANAAISLAQAQEASSSCVDIEVDGQRTMSYACLQEKLQKKALQEAQRPKTSNSETIIEQAPNRLGMPTPATLSNRMGNNLGHSVKPQRPDDTPTRSPLLVP